MPRTIRSAIRYALSLSLVLVMAIRTAAEEPARARRLAAAAEEVAQSDRALRLLLAREACEAADVPESRTALYSALVAAEALTVFEGHASPVWGCGMPSVQERVYTLDSTGTLRIWTSDGKKVADLKGPNAIRWWAFDYGAPIVGIVRHNEKVATVFDLDGKPRMKLAAEGGMWIVAKGRRIVTWIDRDVHIWDGDGQKLRSLSHQHAVYYARPDAAGKRILVSLTNQTARVYTDTGELIAEWRSPDLITNARWRKGGDRFVAHNKHGNRVRLLDSTGKQIAELGGHERTIMRARFSNAGDMIVTSSEDGNVIIWNAKGEALGAIPHPRRVQWAGFLPGDQQIVTVCDDGITRVWTRRGHLVAQLHGHLRAVRNVGIPRSGKWLLTCSDDTTARLWPLELATAMSIAAKSAGRAFTPEEKKRYLDPR